VHTELSSEHKKKIYIRTYIHTRTHTTHTHKQKTHQSTVNKQMIGDLFCIHHTGRL